ncbi:energy transducer TonB [uncultured Tateyamaria sp.]|uniref:energy transducer TonB family protein n=1 Tax=uncultured Tateyamaria sp. TaxID=455651 RepID=UPI00261A191F|nr:TonB family protein [uncultured Tateyamaria sp.]
MTVVSRPAAIFALLVAVVLHAGGLMRLDLIQPVEMEGGQAGATEASLGNSFADLAQGTLTGVETTDVTEPVKIEETSEPIKPDDRTAETAPPEETQAVETENHSNTQQPSPPKVTPGQITKDQTKASALLALTNTERVPQATLRARPSVSTPRTQPETLTAKEPDQVDLTQSLRPKVRSRAFEVRNKPDDPPPAPQLTTRTASRTPDAPTPRGDQAKTNTRAGEADGTAAITARQATGTVGSTQTGNAAASNYPGKVMRQLQRARHPRVGDRGVATISFRIASNGGLSAVSVARGSGSNDLDRAAMQVIQRAAPFPAPPAGAQRSFSIQIKGR